MTHLATTGRFTWAASAALAAILTGCQATVEPTASPPPPSTSAPPPSASAPPPSTVRLADDGCGLEGDFTLTTAGFRLRLVNDTSDLFSVQLLELSADRSFDDFVTFSEQVQAAVDSAQPVPTLPPWMTEVARQEVEAGQEADLEPSPGAGSYSIMCGRIHPPDDLFRVMTLGPIEVTESQ